MRTLVLVALLTIGLVGCEETPEETRKDVAEAKREGAQDVREAQRERAELDQSQRADGRYGLDRAGADYEVAKARAKAKLNVEQERCDGLASELRDPCRAEAEAIYDRAIADAERSKALAEQRVRDGRRD